MITLSRVPKSAEDDPNRIMTVTKTNIGVTGASLRYELTGSIEEPHVVWACELPADEASRGYDVNAEPASRQRASTRGRRVRALTAR